MNDRDLLLVARTLFGKLSLPMEEGRAQELSRDVSTLCQRISAVTARLEFDDLPGEFRRLLQSETAPPQSSSTAEAHAEAAAPPLPGDDDPAQLDLVAAVEATRTGLISSRELVSACLARISRLQAKLNCFIEIDSDAALAAADCADAERARGNATGRLHGVPLAHKDMFYRQGTGCSCGSRIRQAFRADTTATVLSRLDAQGAVTIGALNMVQFAAGATGHNRAFGDCRNPWNTDYSPGGSSSGSGSAVAARLVYGALGSDTGGSVRLPAAMCGVVGLKPTRGRISCHGAMPRSWTTDVVGTLTRTARDCARLLTVLAGPDPMDPDCANVPVADYEALLAPRVKGVTLGFPRGEKLACVSAEIMASIEAVRATLQRLGANVVEVDLPDIDALFALAELMLKTEAASLHERWMRERPHDYDLNVRAHAETGLFVPAVRYMEADRLRGRMLREFLTSTLREADMLLAPVLAQPVPLLAACNPSTTNRSAAGMATLPYWTRWVSYLGVPAIAVPCGIDSAGLPMSFQLVGRPFREDLLLRAAHAYQEATEWHKRMPSGVL